MEEYKHIQELRGLWSQNIMNWTRLIIPVGGVLFGFFSYIGQLNTLEKVPYIWLLPVTGGVIFITSIITWRCVVHHIDKQIVRMYPRMLELERNLGWSTHASYYFYNLSDEARQCLNKKLGSDLSKISYEQYVREAESIKENPYSLLLYVWDKYRNKSVGSRGHCVQDIAAGIIVVAAIFATLALVNIIFKFNFFS